MSRKIKEFFKTIPLMEVPKEYQQCQVIVKDIREEIANGRVGDFKIRVITDKDKKLDEKSQKIEHKFRFCEKKIRSASTFSTHMLNTHPEQFKGLLKCQICQRKFIKKNALEWHIKVKHFDGKIQLFECDFCGKSTKSKSNMCLHMKIHLPTVNCDICHAELKQSSIKGHMKETHAINRKFQCKMCPKMFKVKTHLWKHQKTHNKRFQCTTCIKTFSTKYYLLKHQKEIHENPGSYGCEVCGKKFNQEITMKIHLKVHDRHRLNPFKCNRCDYETDIMGHLKRHQQSHARQDEKFAAFKNPLKCPKCPTLSKNMDALNKHLKAVHPDEPFQCDLCGRYLKTFSSLKNHLKLLHQQRKK